MLPLAAPISLTLADVLDDTLGEALASGSARCIWCGGETFVAIADRWTGRVVLRCPDCGSELDGVGRRRPRESLA